MESTPSCFSRRKQLNSNCVPVRFLYHKTKTQFEIDNFSYWLAEKGFLTGSIKEAAERTRDVKLMAAKGTRRTRTKRWVLLLTHLVLLVGWTSIWISDTTGRFVSGDACKSFHVQFGDDSLLLDSTRLNLDDTLRANYKSGLIASSSMATMGGSTNTIEMLYAHFSGTYVLGKRLERSKWPFLKYKRAVYTGKSNGL